MLPRNHLDRIQVAFDDHRYLVGVGVHTHRPAPEHADQPVAYSVNRL